MHDVEHANVDATLTLLSLEMTGGEGEVLDATAMRPSPEGGKALVRPILTSPERRPDVPGFHSEASPTTPPSSSRGDSRAQRYNQRIQERVAEREQRRLTPRT